MTGTIRLYYDAVIAVALMTVVATVCGFVAAVITGGSPPSFPVAAIAFLLLGLVVVELAVGQFPLASAEFHV